MTAPHDVVIVGAGVVGSILANALGRAGARVLLLEAADELYFDRQTGADQRQPLLDFYYEATVREPNSPYPDPPGVVMPRVHELGKHYYGTAYGSLHAPNPEPSRPVRQWGRFASTYTRIVGGTTYHWQGTCLRHEPATFREHTLYGHSVDWPIDYDDLEEWYWKAEHELGVAGDAEHALGAPRNGRPYPMPPILPSWTDRVMAERLRGEKFEGIPLLVEPTPQARNSVPYQDRPVCAGSSNCVPICPIQAKYDATVHLKRALEPRLDPNTREGAVRVELRTGMIVSKVLVGGDGTITGLEVRRPPTGASERVQGSIYVLATHAIETARLLLNSGSDQPGLAHGAANSSGCVGRYLMDHPVRIAWGEADVPLYPFRGPLSTSGIETLRDGSFRRARAPFRVEIEAIGTQWARNTPLSTVSEKLAANVIGKALWDQVGWDASRQLQLDALFEPRPDRDSRVTLAKDAQGSYVVDAVGIPRPRLDVVLDEAMVAGAAAFERLAHLIVDRMSGGRQPRANIVDRWYGSGHAMGTHRMGECGSTSVTDSWGHCWDHPNLWLTGSGLFPTAGTANPTLTIVALALRQVGRLLEALHRGPTETNP